MSELELAIKLEEMKQDREQWKADHDQRQKHWDYQQAWWDRGVILSFIALVVTIIVKF